MRNSVVTYLEDIVKIYPNKTAVKDEYGSVTFLQLRNKALSIAGSIKQRKPGKQMPVFVFLPKGVHSITAFLGILYSGNFYTPTDVKFPYSKIDAVLRCLEPALILTDTKHFELLLQYGVNRDLLMNIDGIDYNSSPYMDSRMLAGQIIDTDVAYVLFTSGSTGVPKGVIITHRSIIDYIDWARECYHIDQETRIGNQAPFYFDNSTLDIYLCISCGAQLNVIPEHFFSFPAKLLDYVKEEDINFIFWVPSVLIQIANYDLLGRLDVSCLKKVLFAGEVMPNKQLNYWRKYLPGALFSNLYGPTEITVDCTYYIVDRKFEDMEPLPIGWPCKNSGIMVIAEDNKLITEPNITGELCVRGSSLAAGYWNNPEKTKESFVQNPFQANYAEKIYRTGDLVYYNQYHELVFAGRKDFQIKHLGYRIELGEIETAALSISYIHNACALYDGEKKHIILFYEAEEGTQESDIRKDLLSLLPKYMIPSRYLKVNSFPYNDNGKIDRRSLTKNYL